MNSPDRPPKIGAARRFASVQPAARLPAAQSLGQRVQPFGRRSLIGVGREFAFGQALAVRGQ
jgi:hypothetical protein